MATAVDRTAAAAIAEELSATRATAGASGSSNAGSAAKAVRCSGSFTAGLTTLPCGTLVAVVTLCSRRLGGPGGTLLLALVVVVERIAITADDPGALVAVGLEAVLANQRTDARLFRLDRVECIGARHLHVELGAGITVELRQRALCGRGPVAVGGAGEAADAAELGLHRAAEIGRRDGRRQRRDVGAGGARRAGGGGALRPRGAGCAARPA